MLGWFKKAGSANPSRQAPQGIVSASPSLQSVSFDTKGLQHQRDEEGRRIWFTEDGAAAVSLFFFDKPPDLPGDLRTAEQLRQFYLTSPAKSPAKLVEVGIVELSGCKAVRLIIKTPQQPHGMAYLGSFTIPFRDFSFVIKVECPERGTTGIRETMLFEKLITAGKIAVIDPPHISGDWNPDDEKYDADFPTHPLSALRRVLKAIERSCVVDAAIRSQPGFPLPEAGR